jgi:hypothetical protein
MKYKGFGRKRSGSNLRYCPVIFRGDTEGNHEEPRSEQPRNHKRYDV